jgi:hypothetical protein
MYFRVHRIRRGRGLLPRRALAHVREWLELHRDELVEAWKLVADGKPALSIEPLE